MFDSPVRKSPMLIPTAHIVPVLSDPFSIHENGTGSAKGPISLLGKFGSAITTQFRQNHHGGNQQLYSTYPSHPSRRHHVIHHWNPKSAGLAGAEVLNRKFATEEALSDALNINIRYSSHITLTICLRSTALRSLH